MGGNTSEYGRCLAWCHLYGDIDPVPGSMIIKPGKEASVLSQVVPPGQLIASVLEFDVNVPVLSGLQVVARTLVTPQGKSDCPLSQASVEYLELPILADQRNDKGRLR